MTSKKGKGIGGFLKGAAASSKVKRTTEAELVDKAGSISPDDVLGLSKPTEKYLCKTTDNTFGIEFVAFKLRDLDKNATLVSIEKPEGV